MRLTFVRLAGVCIEQWRAVLDIGWVGSFGGSAEPRPRAMERDRCSPPGESASLMKLNSKQTAAPPKLAAAHPERVGSRNA